MLELAFCSKCDHSEKYGTERYGLHAEKTKTYPKPEFCSKCGEKMLYACPNCGAPRRSMEDKFCVKCGKAYK